eukprot:CAMPEP_0178910162 /NCGR_PEP_ID=MMETSP0786-20121207/8939_1 /TAXON_ID=186022 /ORGANISM="Thalassionema frauenfeldii, Strain CCMP 1798" /LENGTH=146 /DNA_ID=CAMNT_0020582373 /DNA_START=4878 /DNA_END=5318 /DNA_ORIENTATION=+
MLTDAFAVVPAVAVLIPLFSLPCKITISWSTFVNIASSISPGLSGADDIFMNNSKTSVSSTFSLPVKFFSQDTLGLPPADTLAASEHFLIKLASHVAPLALTASSKMSTRFASSHGIPIISNANKVLASSVRSPSLLSNLDSSRST